MPTPRQYSIPDNGQVVGGAPFFWVHWCMPAPVYGREEYTPLGGEVRVEQEHQMHQMSIYSGVYTEETLPLKPIVSEVRGGGVSEESDGCLGGCIRGAARSDYSSGNAGSHWATVFLPRGRGKKIVVIHSVNQGVRHSGLRQVQSRADGGSGLHFTTG